METAIHNIIQTIRGHKDWLRNTPDERRDFFFGAMKFQMAAITFMGKLRIRKREEYDPWITSQQRNTQVKELEEELLINDENHYYVQHDHNMTSASEQQGNYVSDGSNSVRSPSEQDLESLNWETIGIPANFKQMAGANYNSERIGDPTGNQRHNDIPKYQRDPTNFRKSEKYAKNVTGGGGNYEPSQLTQSIKDPEWISVSTKLNPTKDKSYFTLDVIEDWNVIFLYTFNSLMFVDEDAPRLASSLTKFKSFNGEKPELYEDFKDGYISAILNNRNLNYAMIHQALMDSLEGIAKQAAMFKRPKGLVNLANCFEKLDKEFGGPTTRKTGLINAIKNLAECNMHKVHTLQEAKYTVEELLNEMESSGTVDKNYSYQLILPLIKHDEKTQSDYRQYRRLRGLATETIDNWMTWIGDLIEDSRRTRYDKSLATETQVTKQVTKTQQRAGFKQKQFPPFRQSKVFLSFDGERTVDNTIEEESEEVQENCTDSGIHTTEHMDQYETDNDATYDQYHGQETCNQTAPVMLTNESNASGAACMLCQGKHQVTQCPEKSQVSPNVMKSLM
jgi:hypothetical protein